MQVTVKVENKKVSAGLQRLGESIPRVVNADIDDVMQAAIAELRKPGKPIDYPVNWDSERQRRAYFATDGFGHGIPYKRTGAYNTGFSYSKTGSGTSRSYTLYNKAAYAKYVGGSAYGSGQSRIHSGRWPIIQAIVKRYAENLVKVAVNHVREVIRNEGFGL